MNRPQPLRPDRIRVIERPFGWIPFRILTSGLLAQLGVPARALYFFLCLVADSNGLSFYGDYRTTMLLKLAGVELRMARQDLMQRDLLAYDGRVYQLLSLPDMPEKDRGNTNGTEPAGAILGRLGIGG